MIPSDVVTENRGTYSEAQTAGLFERGWLPDIIPPTSKNIKVSNDLDVNTSDGEFYFSPDETNLFTSRLKPLSQNMQADFAKMKKHLNEYSAYQFTQNNSIWVFFIDSKNGHVVYSMRSSR
jgi:hypothetical protein